MLHNFARQYIAEIMNILSSIQKAAPPAKTVAAQYTLYTNASTGSNQYVTYTTNTQTVSGITNPLYQYANGIYVFTTAKSLTNAYLFGNTTNTTSLNIGFYNGSWAGTAQQGYYNDANVVPTDVDGVSQWGAWYEIKLPYYLFVSSYYISSNTGPNVVPLEWVIAGSNDGVNYTTIDTVIIPYANKATAVNKTYTLPAMKTIAYKYIRLIVLRISNTATGGSEFMKLQKIYYNGTAAVGNYTTRTIDTSLSYHTGADYIDLNLSNISAAVATDQYNYYWSTTDYGSTIYSALNTTAKTCKITGLTAGTSYKVWATVKDTTTNVVFGGGQRYITIKTRGDTDTDLTVDTTRFTTVTVSLNNISLYSTDRYNFYWSTTEIGATIYSSLNNTAKTYSVTGLQHGTEYYIWATITDTVDGAVYGSAERYSWVRTYDTDLYGTVYDTSVDVDLYHIPAELTGFTYSFYWTSSSGGGSYENSSVKTYSIINLNPGETYTFWGTATDTATGIIYGGIDRSFTTTMTSIPVDGGLGGGGGLGMP